MSDTKIAEKIGDAELHHVCMKVRETLEKDIDVRVHKDVQFIVLLLEKIPSGGQAVKVGSSLDDPDQVENILNSMKRDDHPAN